jgi:predicted homoserine dehydrogenase-like protein
VAIDQPLTYDDVELDEGSTILQLRRLQDLLLRNGPPASRPSVPGT